MTLKRLGPPQPPHLTLVFPAVNPLCRSSIVILMQKLSYYTSTSIIGLPQTTDKDAGEAEIKMRIVLLWIDPVRGTRPLC